MKYVRVMFDNKSHASRFEYKIGEVNISPIWNKGADNPKEMGGFNFSTEDKILRWLHRGDTLYDVTIPDDAEMIIVDKEKGIYRSNKIIIDNPRKITEDIVKDLYLKNTLNNKVLYQCLVTLLWVNHKDTVKFIINDKINKNNKEDAINEILEYTSDRNLNNDKSISELINEIKNKRE